MKKLLPLFSCLLLIGCAERKESGVGAADDLRAQSMEVRRIGQAALQALDRGPADAVVLDPGLPDGQGGTVLRRLRCACENVPVPTWVAFSVMDRAEVNRTYGDLGDRFLRTPFDPWQLVKPLESLLKEVNGASGRREATKLEEEAGHVLAQ